MRKSVYDYDGVSPSKGQQFSTCLLLTVVSSPGTRRVGTARKMLNWGGRTTKGRKKADVLQLRYVSIWEQLHLNIWWFWKGKGKSMPLLSEWNILTSSVRSGSPGRISVGKGLNSVNTICPLGCLDWIFFSIQNQRKAQFMKEIIDKLSFIKIHSVSLRWKTMLRETRD